jgi:hypothetical protein
VLCTKLQRIFAGFGAVAGDAINQLAVIPAMLLEIEMSYPGIGVVAPVESRL